MKTGHHQIVIVTAALAVASFVYGLSMPLMSLALTKLGASSAMIGLSTAAQFLAVFIVVPFISHLINAWGTARAMFYAIILTSLVFLLFPVFPNVYAWFPLRILLGICGSVIWIGGEAWINDAVGEHKRGRVIALYTMVLAAGFALGPLLLSITGSDGWAPFLVSSIVTALGALPLLVALDSGPGLEGQPSVNLFRFVALAPVAMLVYFAFAATDSMVLTFLPPYAIDLGLSETGAVNLITVLAAGSMLFMWPLGWLADHMNRMLLAAIALIGMLICALLLPIVLPISFWNYIFMLVWGGIFAILYSLPLVLLGQQFKGADLAAASAVFGIMFSVGSIAGPVLGGIAIEWFGQNGMPGVLALIYMLILPLPFFSRQRCLPV